jgi:hypothetical protein
MLLGADHMYITTNPNQSVLQRNGNMPFHLQPKSLRLQVVISWEDYAYRILGISGTTISPFLEA